MLVPLAALASTSTTSSHLAPNVRGEDVVDVFTAEYGAELGPMLAAIARVESNDNTGAQRVTDTEDSRGILQVNTRVWGVAAAPLAAAAGDTPLAQLKSQARAARPVVEASIGPARAIAASTGAPLVHALSLVWQWGAARAQQLAGGVTWSVDAIARRIEMLKDAAAAAAWRARDEALELAWQTILAYVRGAGAGAGASIVVLLLLAWLLFGNKERRARTRRIAGGAARLAASA